MKQFKLLLLIFTISLLYNCANSKVNESGQTVTVDIANVTDFYMDSIADFLVMIPLETTETNLIKQIGQAYLLDSFIVILDAPMHNLLIFNENGKYLYNLGSKGPGPEQYSNIEDVYIDYENQYISILDNLKRTVITYDIHGNFVEADFISSYAYAFYPMQHGYWLLNCGQNSSKNNLILTDKKSKEIIKGFLPSQDNLRLFDSNNFFEDITGKVTFHFPYQDLIYTLDNDSLKPYLNIDFGKMKNPYTQNMNSKEFSDFIEIGEYVGSIHNVYTNDEQLFFSFSKLNGIGKNFDEYNVYITMNNLKVTVYNYGIHHSKEIPVSPLPEIIGLSNKKIIYQMNPNTMNDRMVESITKSELIKNSEFPNITTDSNPILVIYDLKN